MSRSAKIKEAMQSTSKTLESRLSGEDLRLLKNLCPKAERIETDKTGIFYVPISEDPDQVRQMRARVDAIRNKLEPLGIKLGVINVVHSSDAQTMRANQPSVTQADYEQLLRLYQ